jgi:hypothetical protein
MRTIGFIFTLIILISTSSPLLSQTPLSSIGCPTIDKRSNGNGQASSAAGDFRPTYTQNNPVAPNITGTSYQLVPYNPQSKTGNFNFRWDAAAVVSNLPVISRVWTTPVGSETAVLSPIKFGPPPPLYTAGNFKYANYCFYVQNMANAGRVTLEFLDPQTNAPIFWCTYDLSSGLSAAQPTNFSCGPTVTTAPINQTFCGTGSVTFTASITGYTSYKWQQSSNNSTWTDITAGGDFTTANATTLTINNRSSYTGKYFRIAATNSCGTTNSSSALLTVNPLPTAVFTNSSLLCGTGISRSLGVDFTGTGPWSFTYTVNGTPTTVSNITTDPYYFTVTPAVATAYVITSVSDSKCSNTSPSGALSVTVNPNPTLTYTNTASVCEGSSSFGLAYSGTTNSPNQFSVSTGTRVLTGFSAINNSNLGATPQSITIPTSGNPAGDYDFNITVTNSSTGCTSSSYPLVFTLKAKPVMTASTSAANICTGASATLTATGASTYSWVSSPAGFTSSSASASISPSASTTYTVTGTGSNGCTNTASTNVIVFTTTAPLISATLTTICGGQQTVLTASGGNTYSWSGPSSYSATGATIAVAPLSTGTYTVTATNSDGCTSTASQVITVSGGPTITGLSPVTICQGASTTLTAGGATTYAWSTGATTAAITVSPTNTTTYTVVGTTGSCSTSANVTVTVTQSPVTSVPNQVLYCSSDYSGNQALVLTITTSSNQTFTWSRSTNNSTWGTTFNGQYSLGTTSNTTTSTVNVKTPGTGDQYFRVAFTTGGCTYTYPITLINLSTVTITATGSQTICSGSTPSSVTSLGTPNATGTSITYATVWESSTDNFVSNIVSTGVSSASYSPGSLSQTMYYRYKVTPSGSSCVGPYYSNIITISIATAVSNNTLSTSNACAAGTAITGSTPTGGSGSYTYSWESSTTSSTTGFTGVAGVTTQSYTPPVPSVTTWYRRLVTSGSCSNSTSTAIAIHPPLSNIQISNGQTLCSGTSITALTLTPSGGQTGSTATYDWQKSTTSTSSGFSATGTTTQSYTPTTASGNTEYFRVVVTVGACTATSNSATIIVRSNPTITVSPSSATVCSGANATLTASGGVSYSWSPATDLSSTTGAAVVTTPTASRTYTITGTDANGCTNTATSTITYGVSPLVPSLSSTSGTICNTGTSVNLSSLAANTSWFTIPSVNASYAVSSPSNVSAAGTYYAFGISGSCYSNSYATYTLSVDNVSAPAPTDLSVEVCSPSTVNLTSLQPVANTGTTLKWFTVASNPTTEYATPTTASAGTYYLYAYSTGGNCYGSASSAVTILQNSLPTVNLSGSSSTVCEPNTIDLTSKISSPNPSFTYNWYSTSTNPPVTSDLVANATSIDATGTFYVYAFNNVTGCKSASPESFTATINADPALSLTSPDVGCSGASTSLSVSVTNGVSSPTYQWKLYDQSTGNFNSISNGGVYSGTTTTTLAISSITGLDGAAYYCTVTAGGCSANSSVGVIGVSQPNVPTASITHPTCTVSTGTVEVTSYPQDLTFSLSAPTGYQSSTTFNTVASGTYTLTAKDLLNCTNTASVTVNPQPAVPLAPTTTSASACVYNLPAGTVADNVGNGFSSPKFKWYTVNNSDTSANYQQRSTATSFQTRIMTTTTHYVAVVHPTSGCESSRTSITNTVIDPLSGYNPAVNDYVWKGGASADIDDWKTATNWYQFDGTKYWTVSTAPSTNDNVFIPPTGDCIFAQPHVQNENTQQFINLFIKTGGSLTIEGNGVVNVSGDWTNDGTFIRGSGTVNFVGAGNHFIKGTSTTTFNNFVVNKPLNGSAKSVLKLNVQAHIAGEMTLTAGLFDISTFDINMDARTINGGSSASYVQTTSTGRLQRDVASSARVFPVGRSSYNPATLTNTGTSDKYSIRVVDRLTNIGTQADNGTQSDSSVVKRTWMIDENVIGGSDVTLRLDWNGDEHHGSFDQFQPYIAHFNSSINKWENKGWANRTYDNSLGFVQTTGITSFSPFGISSPEGGVALPVELLYFNTSCDNNNVLLNWATASEHNNLQFVVLSSRDGLNWNENATIAGAGNSTEKIDYHFTIKDKSQIDYIKLLQVDFDGKITEYGPYATGCDDNEEEFKVFPIPVTDNLNIQVANRNHEASAEIRLIGLDGTIVLTKDVDFFKGINSYQISVNEEIKGVYFIEFIENNKILRKKIVIH